MDLQYIFYYKKRGSIEHIFYIKYDFNSKDDSGEYGKIGSTEKLIEFIKRNCTGNTSVVFEGFDSNRVLYILNSIADEIDTYPTSHDNCYDMFKKIVKRRGKNNGLD